MTFSKMSSLGGGGASNNSGGDHFDSDQPRVPAGHPNGGQWTSLGSLLGDGIARADLDEPFGPEQPLPSRLPEDAVRLAFAGSEANTNTFARAPVRAPNLFPPSPLRVDRAESLFDRLSADNDPDSLAVLQLYRREPKFTAFGFTRAASEPFLFSHATVERLPQEDVEKACKAFTTVQKLLDLTHRKVLAENPDFNRGQIGSRMHRDMAALFNKNVEATVNKEMAEAINKLGFKDLRGVTTTFNLRPESSYVEGQEEATDNRHYGVAGSARTDLREKSISLGATLERLTPDTLCTYEYTISPRPLPFKRAVFLGEMTRAAFPNDHFTRFITVQVRPRDWRLNPWRP
jgi:hypothetical protein